MADKFSYDVFLSHHEKDKLRVRRLAERLKQAGLRVWFDDWSEMTAEDGLKQSRTLVLCISPNALASGWVALERSTALHRDPTNEDRRFIPLLLEECELPDTLRRYGYVDFRKGTKAAFDELLSKCRLEAKAQLSTKAARKSRSTKKESRPPTPPERLAVLERTITADNIHWFTSLVVTNNGKSFVSGSSWSIGSDLIRVWNLDDGEYVKGFAPGSHSVYCLAVTRDGKRVFSASGDATIGVWDIQTGQLLQNWKNHSHVVRSLALSTNDTRVFSASWDQTIKVWDANTGECLNTIAGLASEPFCIVVLDEGEKVAVGERDGSVTIWRTDTKELLLTRREHSGIVHSLTITPDGTHLISAGEDQTIRVWNLEKESCVAKFEGHKNKVHSLSLSPDGNVIASTGFQDYTVRLWDLKSGACLQAIKQPRNDTPISVAFSADGSRLIVGTTSEHIHIYHLATDPVALSTEVTRHYVNAKVVLLGEGTVGKTSLAHRLIEDQYVIRDRTHGMNVWQLDLPLPADATLEREALLWDLAGQEDYRLIHQLFLDETALALLLVNPQKDDPFVEAGDWLKALKAACRQPEMARDVARLLVFSQADVGGMKLSNTKIQRFIEQHGFNDWLDTSAKSGQNCSDSQNGKQPSKLKQLIASSIPWDKLPWTSTPRLLTELKNAVVAMRAKTDIRLMRFAELTQRLEQALPDEKFDESDVRTTVTLLANHGLARALKFGDLVLLQPELLNGYAGAIIRAARANKDEIGSVLQTDIFSADFDFTGVDRLKHRADEELLLHALVQTFLDHSLCIAEDTPQGRQLVFPSQYRREKDIPRDPDIFVSYTFSGEWQSVWTTLVVRLWYSQEFGHKELWRNAAEFASPKGFTLGLKIDNKQGEGTATVSLYFDKEVPDELKAIFIEYVHRHLAKYGCEVSRDRRYICGECGKAVTDLAEVRKRLDAKKDFIYCQGCDEKVPLIDFIEQRLKSDPVARKIMAMDATATRELDTQALEQILIGHMMATCGEANQIFRPTTMFDQGIDGEVEFKDDNGRASGKRIYIQLKSGNSYLRERKTDGSEVFDIKNERHLEYWTSQPVDVFLVIRQTDEVTNSQTIRWMNVTRYLKDRAEKKSRQIIFDGEKLDMEAVWKVRDQFFPKVKTRK